jgi:hypothetical protein
MTNMTLQPTPAVEPPPVVVPPSRSFADVLGPLAEPVGILAAFLIMMVGVLGFAYAAALLFAGVDLLLRSIGIQ